MPGTEAAVGATINGVPLTLVIAAGRDAAGQPALVLGLGPESVTLALPSHSTLGQAASHQAAAQAIGEGAQPSLIAELPTLLSLLEGVGLTQDPTIAPLVPYLRGATTLSGGGHQLSGEIQRYRLVLGLAPAGG